MQVQDLTLDQATRPFNPEGEGGITAWLNLLREALKSRGATVSRFRQNILPDDYVGYLMDMSAAGRDLSVQCSLGGAVQLTMRTVFTDKSTGARVLSFNSYLGDIDDSLTLPELARRFSSLTYKVTLIADHFQGLCEQEELVH